MPYPINSLLPHFIWNTPLQLFPLSLSLSLAIWFFFLNIVLTFWHAAWKSICNASKPIHSICKHWHSHNNTPIHNTVSCVSAWVTERWFRQLCFCLSLSFFCVFVAFTFLAKHSIWLCTSLHPNSASKHPKVAACTKYSSLFSLFFQFETVEKYVNDIHVIWTSYPNRFPLNSTEDEHNNVVVLKTNR